MSFLYLCLLMLPFLLNNSINTAFRKICGKEGNFHHTVYSIVCSYFTFLLTMSYLHIYWIVSYFRLWIIYPQDLPTLPPFQIIQDYSSVLYALFIEKYCQHFSFFYCFFYWENLCFTDIYYADKFIYIYGYLSVNNHLCYKIFLVIWLSKHQPVCKYWPCF